MDEEYLIFADPDGLYPGNIIRSSPPVDWSSLLQVNVERQRRQQQQEKEKEKEKEKAPEPEPEKKPQREHQQTASATSSTSNLNEHETNNNKKLTKTRANSICDKIELLLCEPTVQLDALKTITWSGLPNKYRPSCWKLLLGYLPKTSGRRNDTIQRKRREYHEAVEQHYSSMKQKRSVENEEEGDIMMRQISVDIPRTSPGQKLFQIPRIQSCLQRILYVWAMRHPASGYVQGMNDLVTPFIYVFLTEYITNNNDLLLIENIDDNDLDDKTLKDIEGDSYWCLTLLLNNIQDYYTFSQPGIQRRVHFLRDLIFRVNNELCLHLQSQGVDFLQFAFRWMNCLLMRELPFKLIVRVWDTYLAENDGFAVFHVYVCAALLCSFTEDLLEMDFQELVMFLQNLPTQTWTDKNIDIILSQAYMWRTIFGPSPSHLQ